MLISLKQVFVICFVLLKTVSSTPVEVKGSDGRIYVIEKDRKYNWINALHECGRRDKHLLAIDSWTKRVVINNLINTTSHDVGDTWLGGHDAFNPTKSFSRPFYWSSTGIRANVEFFHLRAVPNVDSNEHCIQLLANTTGNFWEDTDCKTKLGFICEEVDND